MGSLVTAPECEVLIDGLSDDVAFVWVLIHLGIRKNGPEDRPVPSVDDVGSAFQSLARLSERGLVKVGHLEYVDCGPPGRFAPVRHVEEPLDVVQQRVLAACSAGGWEWSCWVVNTPLGDQVARDALAARGAP